MSDYHHVYRPNARPVNGPPDDCPAAMQEEIARLATVRKERDRSIAGIEREAELRRVLAYIELTRDSAPSGPVRSALAVLMTELKNWKHHGY